MADIQAWDKWFYDSHAQGINNPPPVSSNNAMINPAPNTSQMSYAPTAPPVAPTAPTTYVPKAPTIPGAVPAPAPAPVAPPVAPPAPAPLTDAEIGSQMMMQNRAGAPSAVDPNLTRDAFEGGVQNWIGNMQGQVAAGAQPTAPPDGLLTNGKSSMATTAEAEDGKLVYDPAQGGYVKPDTSAIDSKLESYYDPNKKMEAIQAELEASKKGIWDSYNNDLRGAMRDFENRNQEQFSNLARVGAGINPLSSAGQSVANGNELLFNRFKEGLDAERNARIAIAEKTARGEKADAENKYIEYLTNQRKDMLQEAEDNYNRYQSEQESALNRLFKTKQMLAMDRELTTDERDDVRATMDKIFKLQGSMAFADMPEAEMRAMEEKSGYPAGFIKSTIESLRKEEEASKLEASKPVFKQAGSSIMQYVLNPETGKYDMVQQDRAENLKTLGKSVYQITYDEAGNPKMALVPGSPTTPVGGGGGGGGSGTSTSTSYGTDIENKALADYYDKTGVLPPTNKLQRQDLVDMYVMANPGVMNSSLANPISPFKPKVSAPKDDKSTDNVKTIGDI